MFNLNLTFSNLNKIGTRISFVSLLATISVFSGVIPKVSQESPTLSFATYAYAQDYTREEAVNYAKAVYQVELLRQQAYKEIKSMINKLPPNIICDRPETIQALSDEVRQVANRYCQESNQVVQSHNLTIPRFNELKLHYDRGDEFYQQVQNILIELQNK